MVLRNKKTSVGPFKNRALTVFRLSVLVAMLAVAFPLATVSGQEDIPSDLVPAEFAEQIPFLSAKAMEIVARSLGITEVMGKPLPLNSTKGGPPDHSQSRKIDVPIGNNPTKSEEEPTVVANPRDKTNLVAGSHYSGPPIPTSNRCVAYNSFDGGQTWSAPFLMPHLHASSTCSDPVLAYAPDGSRVYYAYMDIKSAALGGFDIVVSFSVDGGQTWVGPFIALDGIAVAAPGLPRFQYDKPWIGTHIDETQSSWVYVTATRFRVNGAIPNNAIDFTRSSNQGVSWNPPATLDSGSLPGAPVVVVQGSRPTGGMGSEVLAAWYHSGTDGFLAGGFEIRTRRSPDNGATWSPIVTAAADSFEPPFFLGPFTSFFRWWATVMPDVEIGRDGVAHIVYTHDPVAGSATPEDGDIRYVSSPGSPYSTWSAPVTINDDGLARAQGFASIETQEHGTARVHATFFDTRLSPYNNVVYDVFHTQKGSGGGWKINSRLTETSSMNDFNFLGDYFDLTVSGDLVFQVWTDRRHHLEDFILNNEDHAFGGRIK